MRPQQSFLFTLMVCSLAAFSLVSATKFATLTQPPPTVGRGNTNPFFYEVNSTTDNGVVVGERSTLIFYGRQLSKDDGAKLVEDTRAGNTADDATVCESSKAAGGVPEAKSMNVQLDGRVSHWTFIIRKEGEYRVCYHHAIENQWVQVSFRNGAPIPSDGDESTSSTLPPVTLPPTEKCPLYTGALKDFVAVKVEVKGKDVKLNQVGKDVSDVLCLPSFSINTFRVGGDPKKNHVMWFFTVESDNLYDPVERYNFLVNISKTGALPKQLGNAEVVDVEGLYAIPIDVQNSTVGKRHGFVLFLTSLFFFAGGALFLYGVYYKYRERREGFGGLDSTFGLADGDIEDLFAPGQATGVVYQEDAPPGTVEAYIEVEE